MKALQPNFEKIKVIIYNKAINDEKILFSLINGKPNFHQKKSEFKKELNHFLDNMDIRSVANLSEEVKKILPKWYRDKKFTIDYNKNSMLDFLIIKDIDH